MLPCMCVQVSGAPPQQPPGPHGPGSEPDQHGHEAGSVRGAAGLDKAQPQIQASSEEPHAPAGLTWLAATLPLLFNWLVWFQMNAVTICIEEYTAAPKLVWILNLHLMYEFQYCRNKMLTINYFYKVLAMFAVTSNQQVILYLR